MCGIVGYIGQEQAAPILLRGLAKLEYRGYDSAGLAVRTDSGELEIVKAKGRLTSLVEKTDEGRAVQGRSGVGHTRWATHGEPSEMNAHPHATDDGEIALVHNGIIENYQELKDKLVRAGYRFHSQTDTEAAVKLVDYYYRRNHDPLEAISRAMLRIRGSYAFGILFKNEPDRLYCARKDSRDSACPSPENTARSSATSITSATWRWPSSRKERCISTISTGRRSKRN